MCTRSSTDPTLAFHSPQLQDDHIKVWEMELQPGATAPLHTHEYSYVFTVLVRVLN